MLYRLNVDLAFETQEQLNSAISGILPLKSQAVTIEEKEIVPSIKWHECYHDEDKPCGEETEV